jgi:maleylacetate reductase
VIVRFGLAELRPLLAAYERPFLISTARWRSLELPVSGRFHGARSHAERAGVAHAVEAARSGDADALVALGGGSAIDTAKAVSARLELPLVAIPTTYAGAEWTPYFGMRDEERRVKDSGTGAHIVAAVYEPALTLELPRGESAGTAMNALAHTAEALYVRGHNPAADDEALAGAGLISAWLPPVLADGSDLEARTKLLEGAMHAGAALGGAGLALGHAMAQALGGRYGLPHGALNAICLPAALRFNEPVAAEAIGRFGDAMVTRDPIGRVEELARLGGFGRLRDFGVRQEELGEVAEAAAARAGARANPREASPDEIEALLRSVW